LTEVVLAELLPRREPDDKDAAQDAHKHYEHRFWELSWLSLLLGLYRLTHIVSSCDHNVAKTNTHHPSQEHGISHLSAFKQLKEVFREFDWFLSKLVGQYVQNSTE
jgi:hypothetical protein